MKRYLFPFVAAFVMLWTFNASALNCGWTAADGYFDDPSSWKLGFVPDVHTQMCQWAMSATTTPPDRTIRLRDYVYTGDYWAIDLLSGYNGSLTFDGADGMFVFGEPNGGNRTHPGVYVVIGGYNFNQSGMRIVPESNSHSVFAVSNFWMKLSHTDQHDTFITFGRGSAVFGGTNEADAVGGVLDFDAGGAATGRRIDALVTNCFITAGKLDIKGACSSNVVFTVSGADAGVKVLGAFLYGYTTPGVEGMEPDEVRVLDGSELVLNTASRSDAAGYCFVGANAWTPRERRVLVDGEGSLFDASKSSLMRVGGGALFCVTNGGTLKVRGSYSVDGSGSATGRVNVAEGGRIEYGVGRTSCTTVSGSYGTGSLTVNGGVLAPSQGCCTNVLYLGQYDGSYGEFIVRSGTVDFGDDSEASIGMVGSGLFEVSGGEVFGERIRLASSASVSPASSVYRQTGGTVTLAGGDSGIYASYVRNEGRRVAVQLDGGRITCLRMAGGGGFDVASDVISTFSADGGTFAALSPTSEEYPFFYGFARAELGEKGLTLDANGFGMLVMQRFTNKEGQDGRLVLTGKSGSFFEFGVSDSDNSYLVCASASAVMRAAVTNWLATVVVTNSMSLDLSQSGELRLEGLVLGNTRTVGNLVVGPGTRVTLSTLDVSSGWITLDGEFSSGTEYPVLTVTGEMPQDDVQAVMRAGISGDFPAGYYPVFEPLYDEESGCTVFTLVFKESSEPSVANVWQGASGESATLWNEPANWSGGTPDGADVVTFSSGSQDAAKSVTVADAAAPLGALSFAAGSWSISGAGSLFFENWGANSRITVAEGEQTVSVDVEAVSGLSITVAEGAKLVLAGDVDVTGGPLKVNEDKSPGVVEFAGGRVTAYPDITHFNGTMDFHSAEAFDGIYLGTLFNFGGSGTLRIRGDADDGAYRLPFGFCFLGGDAAGGTRWGSGQVLDNDRPLVFPMYRTSIVNGGCIVKRGKASAVFETMAGRKLYVGQTNGIKGGNDSQTSPDRPFDIDERTGTTRQDLHSHGAINVLEGELVYRGVGGSDPAQGDMEVSNSSTTFVGLRTTNDVTVVPGIVFDNVYANFGFAATSVFAVAENALSDDYPESAKEAYLYVTNGAVLRAGVLRAGYCAVSGVRGEVAPTVYIDDGAVETSGDVHLSARQGVSASWNVSGAGALLAGSSSVIWNGALDMLVSGGSLFASDAAGSPLGFSFGEAASGTLLVSEGSALCATGGVAVAGAAATVAFDGGELRVPDGASVEFPSAVSLEARAGGLLMDIPQGETRTLACDVAGDGFVTLCGCGTLVLSGVRRCGIGGSGTVRGGTLKGARIQASPDGGESLVFDGTAISGRIRVELDAGEDFRWTKPYPTGIEVARFTGTVPSADAFRLSKSGVSDVTGRRVYGVFTVEDGVVRVDVSDAPGMVLICR